MTDSKVTIRNELKNTQKGKQKKRKRTPIAHISSPQFPRRTPTQFRSKETVECILIAARELFVSLGFAGATTNKIAARAGVSIGSLYQYFPNKTTILMALFHLQFGAGLPRIEAAIRGLAESERTVREGLKHLVEEVVAMHEISPGLRDILLTEIQRIPQMKSAAAEAHKRSVAITADVLRRLKGIRRGDIELMATILVECVEAHSHWIVSSGVTGNKRKDVVNEVVELLYRYIF